MAAGGLARCRPAPGILFRSSGGGAWRRRAPLSRLSTAAPEVPDPSGADASPEGPARRCLASALWRRWVPSDEGALLRAQDALLSHFVKECTLHRKRSRIPFRGSVEVMNCVDSLGAAGAPAGGEVLVLAHGFGAGLGVFMRNYDAFAKRYDRVVGVDWLGMGGSSRPSAGAPLLPVAPGRLARGARGAGPREASAFFVESLESWRQDLGIERMHLVGHSLGAYLSAQYAMRHPLRVASLVLASPAGLLPVPPGAEGMAGAPLVPRMLDRAWQNNVTPQQIVRLLGPRGRGLVDGLLGRRLARSRGAPADGAQRALLSDYVYHVSAAEPSGEFAMNSLLTPMLVGGAPGSGGGRRIKIFARAPLCGDVAEALAGSGMRVGLLFGDRDWLADPLAADVVDHWRRSGIDASIRTVRDAGHHLYLDNPGEFLEHVLGVTSSRTCVRHGVVAEGGWYRGQEG